MRYEKGGSKKIRRKFRTLGGCRQAKRLSSMEVVAGGWAIKRKSEDIFHAITAYLKISGKVKLFNLKSDKVR